VTWKELSTLTVSLSAVASDGLAASVHPGLAWRALKGGSVTARACTGQRQRIVVQPVVDEHAALAEPRVLAVHIAASRLHVVRRQLAPVMPAPRDVRARGQSAAHALVHAAARTPRASAPCRRVLAPPLALP